MVDSVRKLALARRGRSTVRLSSLARLALSVLAASENKATSKPD